MSPIYLAAYNIVEMKVFGFYFLSIIGIIYVFKNPNPKYKEALFMGKPYGYTYIDYPYEGWMAGKWDWTHSIGCGLATILYVVPGIIFLIWKFFSRQSYQSEYERVKDNNSRAFEYTGCYYLVPVTHLGGHPFLPYNQKILLGIDNSNINFYSYTLDELSTASFDKVKLGQNRNTSPTTSDISFDPNSLKILIDIEGVNCSTEFDIRPNDPRYFWQVFNKALISNQNH